MKTTTGLVISLTALLSFAACGDDDDDGNINPDNPALVSAIPADGFTNRTLDVVLIGEDTSWNASSTVDFGAGITVNSQTAAGSTGLNVNITIAADADLGARDLTVTDSVGTTMLAGGFSIAASLTADVQGVQQQGGAPKVTITNNDPSVPFDLGDVDGVPNLTLAFSDESVGVFDLNVSATSIDFIMATDVNAPASIDFSITNGVGAAADTFSFAIAPTTPTPLTAGTDIVEAFAAAHDSAVYTYTATDLETLTFDTATVEGGTEPAPLIVVLDSTGTYASRFGFIDNIAGDALTLDAGETIFIAVLDFSGSAPYTLTAPNAITLAIPTGEFVTQDDATNNLPAGADVLPALPGAMVGGDFAEALDQDWIAVTIAAGDAANDLLISTGVPRGTLSGADTKIFVFTAADTVTPIATSSDLAFFDVLNVPAPGAGDYLIQVAPSPDTAVDPADSAYRTIVQTVAPPL